MDRTQINDPTQWLPRELFAAYCGADSSALLRYYDKAKAKRKLVVMDLDWLALLLQPAWLGYHRRWAMCAVFTACICGSFVFESIAHVQIPSGAFAGTGLALGFMARGLLLTDANGMYLKLKRQGVAPEQVTQALAGQGKGSWATAVLAALASVTLIVSFRLLLPARELSP